ncbi:transposase family protein [Streptomyces collinus]|uniref:transposase family protein n=1 Tax=Streptomyces collinus TaxID=42684 RepID=UPI003652FB86
MTQAIIVLAVLRHDQRLLDMAGGNDVSASTVRRWVLEVLGLLAARAPRLDRALKKIARRGGAVVLLDGILVRTRRHTGTDNRKNYSGKHKAHGLLFLALTDEKGNLIWISSARPGRASEITAARHDHITRHPRGAGLGALADLGFLGPDDDPDDAPVTIPGRKATRSHRLTDAEKEANRLVSRERAAAEHGFANVKIWCIRTAKSSGDRRSPDGNHSACQHEDRITNSHQYHDLRVTMKRSHWRTRLRMLSVAGCRCPRVQPPSHVSACRAGCRTLGALRGPLCPLAVVHAA